MRFVNRNEKMKKVNCEQTSVHKKIEEEMRGWEIQI